MALTIEQKRARWNRLELMGYVAHYTAYPESYSRFTKGRLNPSWGRTWLTKVETRLYRLKRRMLEREGSAGPRFCVSWGPNSHGTYMVTMLTTSGADSIKEALGWDEEKVSYDILKEVETWGPLPNVDSDSESGGGYIYCSPADLPEVQRRLAILEPHTKGKDPTDQWTEYGEDGGMLNAPKVWGTSMGYRLHSDGGGVTLKTPETIEDPTREELIADIKGLVDSLGDEDVADLRRYLKRAAVGKIQDAYCDPAVD